MGRLARRTTVRQGYNLPTRHLVDQNDAAMIQRADVPRSRFIGSWTRKTAFDAGYIVPFMVDEILPGDHMRYDVTAYVRMSTPLFPMFDNQRVDTFFFFVPNRLVWTNWVAFMGEGEPGAGVGYTIPNIDLALADVPVGSIWDHFGIPQPAAGQNININVLPARAYNLIYNTWYRDENLVDSLTVNLGNSGDLPGSYGLRRRAKSHDYFTSALPWAQKFTAPSVPLSGTAPVTGIGLDGTAGFTVGPLAVYETSYAVTGNTVDYANYVGGANIAGDFVVKVDGSPKTPRIYADLSEATGVTINVFRQAFMIQSLLERDARGGTRYVELIRSHFGVTNPDFRLQRPEYIGGGSTPLQLTPIAQTAPTATEPLGALGAAGTAAGNHSASYAATEHGYILAFINVKSELSYQQGLWKLWSRSTRYDFYWPALAGLGEQAILRQEIYATGDNTNDTTVFGYQERWHEYRTRVSEVTGMMRSGVTGTLDAWHLAQEFDPAPTLNATFINDTPPMERILAAGEEAENQQYLADILIKRNAVRPIPTYGTPVLLGRF